MMPGRHHGGGNTIFRIISIIIIVGTTPYIYIQLRCQKLQKLVTFYNLHCELYIFCGYIYELTRKTEMNRIQRILRQQGRTQAFLCRMMDKSTNTVSLWCRNKVQPSVRDLYRIAEILDVEVADLLIEKEQLEGRDKQ